MVRGIRNISGVSCHISCALQILCHVLVPLREILIEFYKISSSASDKPHNHVLYELGKFLSDLIEDDINDPVDPTLLYQTLERQASINWNDVGDASTVLCKLLQFIKSRGPTSIKDGWDNLLNDCVHGGTVRQTLVGQKQGGTNEMVLVRTKQGNPKSMAFPYPLVGPMVSIDQALQDTFSPKVVNGYDWDRSTGQVYEEEVRPICRDSLIPISRENWTTTKTIHLEHVPQYWCLHLERFTYQEGLKALSNPEVDINTTLDLKKYLKADDCLEKYNLVGGICHVTESSIEEEGHVVTLIRQSEGEWLLLDDEECRTLTENSCLALLRGAHDERGYFFCGTLLIYGKAGDDPTTTKALEVVRNHLPRLKCETPTGTNGDDVDPSNLVGRRLRVKWAKEKYYSGIVTSYDAMSGKHRVQYDDGDVREYILSKKTIVWEN